jgi:hypothetical protein
MIRAIKMRGVLGFNFIHKKQLAISVATILFQNSPISSQQQYRQWKSKLPPGKRQKQRTLA